MGHVPNPTLLPRFKMQTYAALTSAPAPGALTQPLGDISLATSITSIVYPGGPYASQVHRTMPYGASFS